jgi:deoxyribodipyrimidine photo-lyase
MKKVKRAIVWFKTDLRLHDNEALTEALKTADEIYPVYIFDERIFKGISRLGFRKTGAFRAQFVIESVVDLKNSLKEKGIDLIVKIGKPEIEIPEIARQIKSSWVFGLMERLPEEAEVQNLLEKNLWAIGQELRLFRGKMLYYTQDLPFPVAHTPDTFTAFRKEVEKITPIRLPLPSPVIFKSWTNEIDCGQVPSLSDFDLKMPEFDSRSALIFKGGESEALQRLKYYLWDSKLLSNYEETRNGLIGGDFSTKLSAWLAQGCISPKLIYAEIQKYEKVHGSNKSTYWLYFELLWRDYFRLIGKKFGKKIFLKSGIFDKKPKSNQQSKVLFNAWAEGKCGQPFIDANMIELKLSGFMSNRGRQNVASYLVNDLKLNWQLGAEYFESQLIDYDPTSNWVNWLYIAGLGNDPREDRYFNPQTQSRRYDPQAAYMKLWLPELNVLSADEIHEIKSGENSKVK